MALDDTLEAAARSIAPNAAPEAVSRLHRIRLWDLPTRLFHWALVVAIVVAVVSAQVGGEWMELHGWAGITVLGLVAFRIVWGFVGATPSRFATFWPSRKRVAEYLRGRWQGVGHSPLGALSVLALLALLIAQSVTGLFANDDIAFTGPWAARVSEASSQWLTGWHHRLSNGLYALVALHVGAIAVHVLVFKRRLIRPMLSGAHEVEASVPQPRAARRGAWVAAVAVAAFVMAVARGLFAG